MKFEHILQIYWTKGYFFGGKLFYFNQNFQELFENTPGLGKKSKQLFIQRFELKHFSQFSKTVNVIDYQKSNHKPLDRPINILFSQINTVNNRIQDLHKLAIIRLYLIKSYRGRCHALGKPVRGQRTWANAWSSYNNNKVLRGFISETRRLLKQSSRDEKINFKVVKKKYASKKKKNDHTKKKTTCMILIITPISHSNFRFYFKKIPRK
jgi:ribosomal protein S13